MTQSKELPALVLKERFLEILAGDEAAGNISRAVFVMRRDDGDEKAVSRTWVYNERKQDKAFNKAIKRIQREAWELIADECETNLRTLAAKHPVANIFILKNKRPDKWRERQEHTGENGKPIELEMPGLDGWLHANIARIVKHAEADQKSS